jgi:hypothetical protein
VSQDGDPALRAPLARLRYNAWSKVTPCNCWVKVGLGATSLPATGANFLKPWFFIYTRNGRATRFSFVLKFVD